MGHLHPGLTSRIFRNSPTEEGTVLELQRELEGQIVSGFPLVRERVHHDAGQKETHTAIPVWGVDRELTGKFCVQSLETVNSAFTLSPYVVHADASYSSMKLAYSVPAPAHPLIPPSRTTLAKAVSPLSSIRSANQPAARVPRPRDDPIDQECISIGGSRDMYSHARFRQTNRNTTQHA